MVFTMLFDSTVTLLGQPKSYWYDPIATQGKFNFSRQTKIQGASNERRSKRGNNGIDADHP